MITADSSFKTSPRISEERFMEVLVEAGSPWAGSDGILAADLYHLIVSGGHDPAVWLAICGREHFFGTNRDSVLWRSRTKSWTNARSVRMPGMPHEIISDPVRGGPYVRYQSVEDSLRDGMYRIDDRDYVYQQRGAISIGAVLSILTESGGDAYATYVVRKMNEWSDVEMVAQLPGFVWYPADLKHYRPGRPGNISGGAQHYSAGTNSLDWLSRNPNSRVSAHFLIKHEPTLEDRGWQIVRIEDTAWTTGSPYNDFTVAIEYEHTGEGAIPDSAYQVIARTWHEIIQYVEAHDLGAVPIAEIRGHRDWVGDGRICPDGVMVERIRADVTALQDAGTGGYPEITFPTGFALSGAFARFWRELGDDAWRTIGYPTGEEYTGDIYGAEWLIQFTDVGVLGHNPETDETRMLKRDQRQQLDTVERDAREVLERIRELLREAA